MRKLLNVKKLSLGCSIIVGIVFTVFCFFLVVRVLTWPPAGQTVTLTDLSKAQEIYVRSPIFPFRTGNMHILYEGVLSTNATFEVISGDKTIIPLQTGEVSGIYGGLEDWLNDLSVRFVPNGTVVGTLKITAVCGRNFTKEEWEWYHKLYMKEFYDRLQEADQKTKEDDVLQTAYTISDETAIAIAKRFVGDLDYHQNKKIKVERRLHWTSNKKIIRVTFPSNHPEEAQGPDYAAKVTIDADTGELIDILGSS